MIGHDLKELTSSFGIKLSDRNFHLTPREIEACNLMREGFSSKEISSLLHLSSGTDDVHRSNIRKKINISSKKINIVSFLRSM